MTEIRARAKARTNTKPLTRTPAQRACQHQRVWVYRHSKVSERDLPMIAKALGIREAAVVDTAVRLSGGEP